MIRIKGKSYRIILGFIFTYWCFLPTVTAQSNFSFDNSENSPLEFINYVDILVEAIPNQVKDKQEFRLKLWGRVSDNYHIYSISSQGPFAPDPTQMLVDSDLLTVVSPLKESDTEQIFDEAFEQNLQVHKHDFWLERTYRLKKGVSAGNYSIKGSLIFQLCSNRICSLPVSKSFTTTIVITKL